MSLNPRLTDLGSKVRLDWDPDPSGQGYRLYVDGVAVARTFQPGAKATTFSKPDDESHRYGVQKMDVVDALEEVLWPEPPPPPSTSAGLNLPAKFHIWGGNEQSKMAECDFVVAAFTSNADPRVARQTNPSLIAASHPALDPWQSDWRQRKGFAWTYGSGLSSWSGANDGLAPNPQGQIRGFTSADNGCKQTDGLQGFAIHKPDTADFIARAIFYAHKLGKFAERGYNGVWSDNLFPGDVLSAGWCYAACGSTISRTAWDAGLVSIARYLRQKGGSMFLGGNVCYRGSNSALRAELNMTLRENLNVMIAQGVDSVWADVQQMYAWASTPTADGSPRLIAVNDIVPQGDTARQRFGLAVALVYGGAYAAYDGSHTNTYWPAEIAEAGKRGYLGKPTAPPQRSGNVLTRQFEHGTVRADFSNRTATFG